MRLTTLCRLAIPLWICAAPPLHSDVTVRYQTDVKLNLPAPAKEQTEKTMRDLMARFGSLTLRMKNGKALSAIGSLNSIIDYNTKQVTLIDHERKTFSTFPLAQFPDKMSAVMPQMPEESKKILQSMSSTMDSKKTGRSDTILGIQAEESEVTVVMDIPVPAGAQGGPAQGGMKMKLVLHIWTPKAEETLRNQALRELTGYNLYANALMNPAGMIQKTLGGMPGKDNPYASLIAELSVKKAVMLRMAMDTYIQMPPEVMKMMAEHNPSGAPIDLNGPMSQMTQEVAELSAATVDDAIYQVPAGFQEVEAGVIIKDMMPVPALAAPQAAKPGEPKAESSAFREQLDQARAFSQKREFGKAEKIYLAILQSDPSNAEVKRLLASVLFRQDKIEESKKVLESISEKQ